MEINLFAKCIKDLIVENDKVEVPFLGVFTAGMVPASYSDRQTTIHPPYRKISFHKCEVSSADGALLLRKVADEASVSQEQALVELGWCLSRLSSELEGRKSCVLQGLGTMRANARNEFFFVPDDDIDIWPDGMGFEPISIKVSEKMPDQVGHDEVVVEQPSEPVVDVEEIPGQAGNDAVSVGHDVEEAGRPRERRRLGAWAVVLIVVGALLVLFVAASYLFTEQMSPILDRLLYTKEELELLKSTMGR